MNDKIRKKIISEYKKGKSSLEIVNIANLSKPTILKVLNEEGLIRKKDRCKSLEFEKSGEYYSVNRACPKCNITIQTKSKNKTICCRNHFNKIKNLSLCKKCSLTLQVGEGNPFYGKKHKKSSINKISNSRKGKGLGTNNSMSNPLWKEKAKKNLIKKWKSGDLEDTRKKMSDKMKETIKLGKIKSVNTSKKEKEIINFLRKIGYSAKQSLRVESKICDIYIPSLNLIIEYFGDYWHCNPLIYDSNYFNVKKQKFAWELWEYDSKKVDIIKNLGYNLEVIWESELKNNNKLIEKIISKYDTKFNSTPERS